MATARDESAYAAGGKFKKRPFRRSTQSTPYDRPPTAVRNPTNINLNSSNNGWFSKLVDPAQRLILSSAHRLFASVFRKRLPPPPSPPLGQEATHEASNMDHKQLSTNHLGVEGAVGSHRGFINSSEEGRLTELEQILKQKTFSRSEIDRLTALLQSRTSEMPINDEQKIPEVVQPVEFHKEKDEPLDTPVNEDGIANQLLLTPIQNSTVLDEDIASPAELAKAYMGSRPSKVSPLMLGLRGQASRKNSGVPDNGFITPRYRGRSAVYSMARAPYSRVHSTTTFKGSGLTTYSIADPSSSKSIWEKNSLTGLKQGSLKRRSSVLDNDVGSVGPLRRIRQKPNLLSLKSLSSQASGRPLWVQESGISVAAKNPLTLMQKPLASNTKVLTENDNVPGTTSTPIPSKSSEMASKILQQLDNLISSKEKSPTKLSPSMLNRQALKSQEKCDPSILMENVHYDSRSHGSLNTPLPSFRESLSLKQEKSGENGPGRISLPNSFPSADIVDAAGIVKDDVCSPKTDGCALINTTALPCPHKQHAFQMTLHENYLEMDDDDKSNRPLSKVLSDENERDRSNSSLGSRTTMAESIKVEKSPASPDIRKNEDGDVAAGKGAVLAISAMPSSTMTAQPAEVATLSTLTSSEAAKESSGSVMFGVGKKFASPRESNDVSPTFRTVTTNVDNIPQFTNASSSLVTSDPPTFKFGASFNSVPESSTSLASVAVGTTDSLTKVPESDQADNGVVIRIPETSRLSSACTSQSTSSMFSLEVPSSDSTLTNGSISSCPSSTSSPIPFLFSGTGFNKKLPSSSTVSFATTNRSVTSSATTSGGGGGGGGAAATAPAPFFKFGSSAVPSTSISPLTATNAIESTEAKRNDASFGNSTCLPSESSSACTGTGSSTCSAPSVAATGIGSSIFGGTLAAFSTSASSTFGSSSSKFFGTGSGIFAGASTPITSTCSNSSGVTSLSVANTGSGVFGFSAGASTSATNSKDQTFNPFAAGSAEASVNATSGSAASQAMPTQFGSSALSTMFGTAANSTLSSSSSMFGSSSAAKPFGSFGLSSPSPVFAFGASSASSGARISAPVFGSSTNVSSSSMFPFSSAATGTSPSLPVFGNSNSVNPFVSVSSNSNDQMNMEDTMAEDAIPTSSVAVSTFGQQSMSPSSSFVFGATAPSGANSFQFGSQQNLAPAQNTSSFQASGNGGGSFSLGTGGDKTQRRIVKVRKQRKK